MAYPSEDSNLAPSGPEPDVLSPELDGQMGPRVETSAPLGVLEPRSLVDVVGLEPTMPKATALQAACDTRR